MTKCPACKLPKHMVAPNGGHMCGNRKCSMFRVPPGYSSWVKEEHTDKDWKWCKCSTCAKRRQIDKELYGDK